MNKIIFLFCIVLCFGCGNNKTNIPQQQTNIKDIKNQVFVTLDNDSVKLSDIVTHKHLVFRYSVLDCKSCIDSLFYFLKMYEDKIGRDNILLLTYYNNLRDFVVNARLNKIHYRILQIPENRLFIKEDESRIPYFFNIDRNMNPVNFFFITNINKQKYEVINYLSSQQMY
ncbi:MAG: hypothetical protein LBG80_05690 [Bacteroidales bacterium]|jgi:hypothetical protein|nr:hypothetical protein [Bacteroidales bacterium]